MSPHDSSCQQLKGIKSSIVSQREAAWIICDIQERIHGHNEVRDIKRQIRNLKERNINLLGFFFFVTVRPVMQQEMGCITEEWFMWMMSSCSASFYSHHEERGRLHRQRDIVIYFLTAVLRLQPLPRYFISDSSGQICLSRSRTDIFILGRISVHQFVYFSPELQVVWTQEFQPLS